MQKTCCKVFLDAAWTNNASIGSAGVNTTGVGVHILFENAGVKVSILISAIGSRVSSPLQAEAMALHFAAHVASQIQSFGILEVN